MNTSADVSDRVLNGTRSTFRATTEGKPSAFTLRSTVRMATWNILSLAKTGYVEAICQELSKYRVNVAGLTETNLTGAGQARCPEGTLLYSGEDSIHRRGVALFLDKKFSHSLMSWQAVSSRILAARLLHKHGHITLLVAYAPLKIAQQVTRILSMPPLSH